MLMDASCASQPGERSVEGAATDAERNRSTRTPAGTVSVWKLGGAMSTKALQRLLKPARGKYSTVSTQQWPEKN